MLARYTRRDASRGAGCSKVYGRRWRVFRAKEMVRLVIERTIVGHSESPAEEEGNDCDREDTNR